MDLNIGHEHHRELLGRPNPARDVEGDAAEPELGAEKVYEEAVMAQH